MSSLIVKSAARDDVLRQVQYLLDQDCEREAKRFPDAFKRALLRISRFPRIGADENFVHVGSKNFVPGRFLGLDRYAFTT